MEDISYKNLETLVQEIQSAIKNINKGKFPIDQLDSLLDSARLLHERLAILQYLTEKDAFLEKKIIEKNQIDLLDAIDDEEVKKVNNEPNDEKQIKASQVQSGEKQSVVKSINELHSSPQTTLADQFGQQPIEDLNKEIGINEKFLLIENLFKGDNKAYNDAISKLNNFNGIDDAMSFFKNDLAKQYEWNLKKTQVKRFIKLIERRYQ